MILRFGRLIKIVSAAAVEAAPTTQDAGWGAVELKGKPLPPPHTPP